MSDYGKMTILFKSVDCVSEILKAFKLARIIARITFEVDDEEVKAILHIWPLQDFTWAVNTFISVCPDIKKIEFEIGDSR